MNQKEHDALVNELIELNKDFIEIYKKANKSPSLSDSLFDRKGNPIDRITYIVLCRYPAYQFLKRDIIEWYGVSTMWMGKAPEIFETKIFKLDGVNPFEDYKTTYSTEDEALIGHQRAMDFVKNQIKAKIRLLTYYF